jgi:hypothetical protein
VSMKSEAVKSAETKTAPAGAVWISGFAM